jgi:hypothetical protein
MKRRYRMSATFVALVSAVAAVALLLSFGAATEGPLSAGLDRLASVTESLEQGVRERLTGRSRRRELQWFEDYRRDPAYIRTPRDVLFGAWDGRLPHSIEGVVELERRLDTIFPLVHVYTAWGDSADQRFPWRIATTIWTLGSVPVITWEPWLSAFEARRHPALALPSERDRRGLEAVARGDYDFYVDAWAADAARFGHPVMVRFAHEMNDPYRYPWGPQHNTVQAFIAAWRHVVGRFRSAGASNVVFAWSPHVGYEHWDAYYPGDEHVDWVATGALNYGPIARWSQWWTFQEIFGNKYAPLAAHGKPILIAEFGSLEVGGDRAAWYQDALSALPSKYPAVKGVLFFNTSADQTVSLQTLDWTLSGDDALVRSIARAIAPYDRSQHR